MSAPEPFTVNVPFENVALPATPTAPTSWCSQGEGSAVDTPPPPPLTDTESNVATSSTPLLWLVTARPTKTFADIEMEAVPATDQELPSGDVEPVKVFPLRVTLSQ